MNNAKSKTALRGMGISVAVTMLGGAMIWGLGGLVLVAGAFCTAMYVVEYWREA